MRYLRAPALSALLALAWLPAVEEPLLVGSARVASVRQAIAVQGSHHQAVMAQILRVIDRDAQSATVATNGQGPGNAYNRSYLAQHAAAAYLVTGDKKYARIAYAVCRAIYEKPGPDLRLMDTGYGLSRATVSLGFALAWAWCRDAWTPEEQAWMRDTMAKAAVAWEKFGHSNIAGEMHSNWPAVCHGGEIMLRLALDSAATKHARMDTLEQNLLRHVESHGSLGASQEGPVYQGYAEAYLLPAALALAQLGRPALLASFRKHEPHLLPMYIGLTNTRMNAINWGVGASDFDQRGATSLRLAAIDPVALPQYQWWYDRYRGRLSPANPESRYDSGAGGRAWSLLLYPTAGAAADPTGSLPLLVQDSLIGAGIVRNRWRDADDPVVALFADTKTHVRSWNSCEAGILQIAAYGAHFVAGSAGSTDAAKWSQILINERATGTVGGNGKVIDFTAKDGVARLVVDGGAKFAELGVRTTREVLARLDAPDTAWPGGIVACFDSISGKAQTVAWNLATGDEVSYEASAIEDGIPTFTLGSNRLGYLKGWVLAATPTEIISTRPVRFALPTANGAIDAKILVVMSLTKGFVPTAVVDGTGPTATVHVNGQALRYDPTAKRLICTPSDRTIAVQGGLDAGIRAPGTAVFTLQPLGGAAQREEVPVVRGGITWLKRDVAGTNQRSSRVLVPILGLNQRPTAAFTASTTAGDAPLTVAFDASASADPDGQALSYRWDFGDGKTGEGKRVSHTFDGSVADCRVTLTVDDGCGSSHGTMQQIRAGNLPPEISVTASHVRGLPPLNVAFDASGSRDPEGKPLTYSWDFGDGTKASGAKASHTYTAYGEYRSTVTATDASGRSALQTTLITVANLPPQAVLAIGKAPERAGSKAIRTLAKTFGKPPLRVVFDASGSLDPERSDPRAIDDEGDDENGAAEEPEKKTGDDKKKAKPAVAAQSIDQKLTYTWDFGDGGTGTGPIADHTFTAPGQHRVTLVLRDQEGAQTTASTLVDIFDAEGFRQPENPDRSTLVPGLVYKYHEWKGKDLSDGMETVAIGTTDLPIPLPVVQRRLWNTVEFLGFLDIPRDGAYRFFVKGSELSEISLGDGKILDNYVLAPADPINKGRRYHDVFETTISLRAGLHRLRYVHHMGNAGNSDPNPQNYSDWQWEGPGIARQPVPRSALLRSPDLPRVAFTVDRTTGEPPLAIRFDGSASTFGSKNPITEYQWDFGDGSVATGPQVTHTFTRRGSYDVVLSVMTAAGQRESAKNRMLVDVVRAAIDPGAVEPGLAWWYWEPEGEVGRGYMPDFDILEANASGHIDGLDVGVCLRNDHMGAVFTGYIHVPATGVYEVSTYMDDGAVLLIDGFPVSIQPDVNVRSEGARGIIGLEAGMHRFEARYVERTVSNQMQLSMRLPGETAFTPIPKTWLFSSLGAAPNRPPTATGSLSATTVNVGGTLIVTAEGSDPDRDPMTFSWDFGDGQRSSGSRARHSYSSAGSYTITMTARDGRGGQVATTHPITVHAQPNHPPVITLNTQVLTPGYHSAVRLDASATKDPDGDAMTYTWQLGDGRRMVTTEPTLMAGYTTGTSTVNLLVDDGRGGLAFATGHISNPAPPCTGIAVSFRDSTDQIIMPNYSVGYYPMTGWIHLRDHKPNTPKGTPHTVALASGGTLTIQGIGDRNTRSVDGLPSDWLLMSGGARVAKALDIGGIPFERYDLVLYAASDKRLAAPYTATVGSRTLMLRPHLAFDGIYRQATEQVDAKSVAQVAVFSGLSGSSQQIQVAGLGGPKSIPMVAGIQIIDRSKAP